MQFCKVISYKLRVFKIIYKTLPFLCVETQYVVGGLPSTNFQLVDVFLDVILLHYNPNFPPKFYFLLSYSIPPGHGT